MALNMMITVFQNTMLYSLVERHQFFGEEPVASTIIVVICHSTLKLEKVGFSQPSVHIYLTTWSHTPGDHNLQ
jgi:hypothetical protein